MVKSDSDSDSDSDSNANKDHNDKAGKANDKELPDTGNDLSNNGTLFGSLFATLGGLFLIGKRRKNKNNEEK
ncbi:LPXTG cell wall anchor domain-containing protein [Staphylococcus petrasii]|uniref:LPXTG cell wall anchor domain-containing protein n=1 Tax=Staphylococcus petrasii TaxID=1276936 RepID=UPI003B8A6931